MIPLPKLTTPMAAVSLYGGWDLPHADAESRRALELNPNYAEGHFLRYFILSVMARYDEAVQEAKRSMELDPFARPWALGAAYITARQFDAAISELRIESQAHPNDRFRPSVSVAGLLAEGHVEGIATGTGKRVSTARQT